MNYLDIVNAVLRRLREDEVNSVKDNPYSKLIGDLVNDTKREVEDAWNWVQLRNTIVITGVDGVFNYSLSGAGQRMRILDVLAINNSMAYSMYAAKSTWLNKMFNTFPVAKTIPMYYGINGNTNGDPNVDIYPVPDKPYEIHFNVVIPQNDLVNDSDVITIYPNPVISGTWAKAIAERGEDGGTKSSLAMSQYNGDLSDAIAIDAGYVPDETIWNTR